jgi:endogenous inhibitor of DNA gyrase (YacG/DUF329 family)
MIDLGNWLGERYVVPGSEPEPSTIKEGNSEED